MPKFQSNDLNGVMPAMITSFNKDESINKEGLRNIINHSINEKVNGLYVTGSTGETFLMSPEEKKKVIDVKFVATEEDKEFIRELQKDMEIVDRPFQKAAESLGMTEDQVFEKLHHYEEIGVMRRYAAILRHREAGFTANGMIVWKVPKERIT